MDEQNKTNLSSYISSQPQTPVVRRPRLDSDILRTERALNIMTALKRHNKEHVRIFGQKVRAVRKLAKLATKGNEYAEIVLNILDKQSR